MVDIRQIGKDDVIQILQIEESHFLDLKATAIKPAKLSKSISAFANASGGELFIGVWEQVTDGLKQRSWLGFEDLEAANPHFQVLELLGNLGEHYKAEFLSIEEETGYVLHLVVPKSKSIVNSTDGTPYIRRNAQNLPVNDEESMRRLRLDKGIDSFEDEVIKIPLDTITNSTTIIEFALSVVPNTEPEIWLQSQFLINEGNPTVAGTLLFCDEPQAALPKRSSIKLYRYKTKEAVGNRDALVGDPQTVEGSIYQLISQGVVQTKALVEGLKKLGPKGLEDVVYPDETLHEVVTNAVLHRDYSIASDIHIRVFDDRIEIESPGKLPGHVTVPNILNEQYARNPKLVRLINKFPNPPNKDVGEGLNTAFDAMNKLRLKNPIVKELENAVLVEIAHTALASPEDTVMEYLNGHDEIKNGIARELTGIRSENTMKEVFYRLAARNLIKQVEGKKGRSSAWERKT